MLRRTVGLLAVAGSLLASGCGLSPGDVVGNYVVTGGLRQLNFGSTILSTAFPADSSRTISQAGRYDIIYFDHLFDLRPTPPEGEEDLCRIAAYLSGNEAVPAQGALCQTTDPDGRVVVLQVVVAQAIFSQELLDFAALGNFAVTENGVTTQGDFQAEIFMTKQ